MKPTALLKLLPDGTVAFQGEEFASADEARKALGGLDVGTYHIVRVIERNVVVQPPTAPTQNVVVRGEFQRRERRTDGQPRKRRKAKAEASGA